MNARRKLLSLLLALPLLMTGDALNRAQPVQNFVDQQRIRFQIATVEEDGNVRRIVSLSTVEGPPGTDFDINLQDARFKMSARFLTDLVAPGALKVRTKLNTRRFYGLSPKNLPLYEEDAQAETLQLGFDEGIVLLPFGRGGDQRLKIEITPVLSDESPRLASGNLRPLEIKIPQQSPGGIIQVSASRTPHRFIVEATLLEDGREAAIGNGDFLIEEAEELILQPTADASNELSQSPLALKLGLSDYLRNRPVDNVSISFDLFRTDAQRNRREPVAANWAGVAELGSPLSYDLDDTSLKSSGRKYELRLKINLAPGEQAN